MPAPQILTAYAERTATPDREPLLRIQDFMPTTATPNIVALFTEQASRCCQCSTKGCNQGPKAPEQGPTPGCPLNTHIPDWLRSVSSEPVKKALSEIITASESGKLTEAGLDNAIEKLLKNDAARRELRHAFDQAMDRNVLSEILGAVCPQAEELCEGGTSREGAKAACVAGAAGYKPITIGNVENLVGRIGRQAGWLEEMLQTPLKTHADTGQEKHISIVGGGPAGLASAMMLRNQGYKVSVYFREDHIGGLLTYGLPGTKLDKAVVLDLERILTKTPGVTLIPRTNVGATEMATMRGESAAVILAMGAQHQKSLNIPNDHLKGVVNSLDFLGASIRKNNLNEAVSPNLLATGKDVAVIGGGDTTMDCVREAVRQGANKVTVLYRGTEEGMRAVEKEIRRAREESVQFDFQQIPVRFVGDVFGHVKELICKNSKNDDALEIPHKTQLVVNSIGFTAEPNLARKLGIHGLLQTEQSYGVPAYKPERSLRVLSQEGSINEDRLPSSRIFVAGDMTNISQGHQCLAVYAVRDARIVVGQINEQLNPPLRL